VYSEWINGSLKHLIPNRKILVRSLDTAKEKVFHTGRHRVSEHALMMVQCGMEYLSGWSFLAFFFRMASLCSFLCAAHCSLLHWVLAAVIFLDYSRDTMLHCRLALLTIMSERSTLQRSQNQFTMSHLWM
jgi:hypothetical protein